MRSFTRVVGFVFASFVLLATLERVYPANAVGVSEMLESGDAASFCKLVRVIFVDLDGSKFPQSKAVRQSVCIDLFPRLREGFNASSPDGKELNLGAYLLAIREFCSKLAARSTVQSNGDRQAVACGLGAAGDDYEGIVGALVRASDAGALPQGVTSCGSDGAAKTADVEALLATIDAFVTAHPNRGLIGLFPEGPDAECDEISCKIHTLYWSDIEPLLSIVEIEVFTNQRKGACISARNFTG